MDFTLKLFKLMIEKTECFFYLAKINGFKPVATRCTEAMPLQLQLS